jgi:hypothetical protein
VINFRSVFRFCLIWTLSFPVIKSAVSSANMLIAPCLTQFGSEFVYIRNNRGPSDDPCGTPQLTGQASERTPSYTTCWFTVIQIWIKPCMFGSRNSHKWKSFHENGMSYCVECFRKI